MCIYGESVLFCASRKSKKGHSATDSGDHGIAADVNALQQLDVRSVKLWQHLFC